VKVKGFYLAISYYQNNNLISTNKNGYFFAHSTFCLSNGKT